METEGGRLGPLGRSGCLKSGRAWTGPRAARGTLGCVCSGEQGRAGPKRVAGPDVTVHVTAALDLVSPAAMQASLSPF